MPLPRPSLADSQLTALDSKPQAGTIRGMYMVHLRQQKLSQPPKQNCHRAPWFFSVPHMTWLFEHFLFIISQ